MEEKSLRKIEMTEDDFLLLIDIKRALEVSTENLLNKLNQVISRHKVRDPAWKGQIIPIKSKELDNPNS